MKYELRQATVEEITQAGFIVEDGQAQHPTSGAWYGLEHFTVGNSATIDGVQHFSKFLSVDDGMPACDRDIIDLTKSLTPASRLASSHTA